MALASLSVASVVEDVLRQHGAWLGDVDLASRKAEEAVARRHMAAAWLRKTVGPLGAMDLPETPSDEEFRFGLRNGIILCNAFNKVHPGAIPKVVEVPPDLAPVSDGVALSAYQYFENVRNFLVALEELGLPTFDASDLTEGGNGARVVNCVLALRSFSEAKPLRRIDSWKDGGNSKPAISGKHFMLKHSEPFINSLCMSRSTEKFQDGLSVEQNLSVDFSIESGKMKTSHSLNMLVRTILSDKKPEEVPLLVEMILSKVMQEFQRRIASQTELVKTTFKDLNNVNSVSKTNLDEKMDKEKSNLASPKHEDLYMRQEDSDISNDKHPKRWLIFVQQKKELEELKHGLRSLRSHMECMKRQHSEEISSLSKHFHVLARDASAYREVLVENRKLYNQVQDLKGNIRVYCRVRPFLSGQSSAICAVNHVDDGTITIITPQNYGKEGHKSFRFNKTFGPSATQEEVFSDTQPLIRSVLDGYNVCIFAYGQTGSGKTFTMSGPKELTEETLGVNYRALNDLFYLSEHRSGVFSYEIAVQMIEIYNEQVKDLLITDGSNKRLEIRNSLQKGFSVPDANMVPVSSTAEIIELMSMGQRNRAVGATAINDRSSRSHSCLSVHVLGKELTSGTILRGCMHLVDLAGSERVDKSEAKGERLKEAQHINKSLSALGDVISALAQKNSHVPYRNSKLTQLLQDALGGNAKTLMFVHISPEIDAVAETIGTLKFAERVASVELGAARANKESAEVIRLREQVANLKAALARKDEEIKHIKSTVSSPVIYKRSGSLIPANNPGQQIEGLGSLKVRSISARIPKKANFDLDEQSIGSDYSAWLDSCPDLQAANDTQTGTEDWFDYQNDSFSNEYSVSQFEEDHEPVATDDLGNLDTAGIDSSDRNRRWQFSVPKIGTAAFGVGSWIKKPPLAKPKNSSDIRNSNRGHVESPVQKLAKGSPNASSRAEKQPSSWGSDGHRVAYGKVRSLK